MKPARPWTLLGLATLALAATACGPRAGATGAASDAAAGQSPNRAANSAAAAATPLKLDCAGPFRRNMSAADLEQMFGKANVSHGIMPGPEGTSTPATYVFAGHAERKLAVVWRDAQARQGVESIQVEAGSGGAWTGPQGLRNGSTLAEVEAANGRPFKLYGFSWDYGGTVSDWQGGRFDANRPACNVQVRFDSEAEGAPMGDSEFSSADAGMKAAKATVSDWGINFFTPDEEG